MDAERLLATSEVAMEYAALKNDDHCPKGMYIIPSVDSVLSWDGVIFVHKGYYADSILKFRIRFPFTYPNRPPNVTFVTDVFHPLISNDDGTLNISPRFSPWRPKQDHVFHLLHWIKVIFKKELLDNLKENDCPNKEAFRLYHDSTQSFAALAVQSAMLSQTAPTLFENAHGHKPHGKGTSQHQDIYFRDTQETELDPLRAKLGIQAWSGDVSE